MFVVLAIALIFIVFVLLFCVCVSGIKTTLAVYPVQNRDRLCGLTKHLNNGYLVFIYLYLILKNIFDLASMCLSKLKLLRGNGHSIFSNNDIHLDHRHLGSNPKMPLDISYPLTKFECQSAKVN